MQNVRFRSCYGLSLFVDVTQLQFPVGMHFECCEYCPGLKGADAKITDYYTEPKGHARGKGHRDSRNYKMIQIKTGREVAVKVVDRSGMNLEKLTETMKILKQAGRHPAVGGLLDVFYDKKKGSSKTNIMLVMELLSGETLDDRLIKQGPYIEEEAAAHVKSIASALKYAEERSEAKQREEQRK